MPKNPKKNFVCIRVAPVRRWDHGVFGSKSMPGKKTGLAGHLAHDFRFMVTPNADMEMTESNLIFCKKTKWKRLRANRENLRKIGIKNEFSIPKRAEKTLRRLKVQVQKNSVVASALMMTISPEVLRDGDMNNKVNDEVLEKYTKGTLDFLKKKFGNRLLIACLHMDEMNPHISAYILPLIKKEMQESGRPRNEDKNKKREIRVVTRLGHTQMFTPNKLIYEKVAGKEFEILKEVIPGTCSILQDEYAAALQKEGLDVIRGVKAEPEKRRLKYVTAKRQYERMMRGVKDADRAIALFNQLSPKEQEETLRQNIALATEANHYRNQRDYYQIQAAAKDEKIATLEKQIADSMRDLSVAEVIEAITGVQPIHRKESGNPVVRHASKKAKTLNIESEFHLPSGQRIGVDHATNSFGNLTPEIPFRGEGANRLTGTGSINAVMYLTGNSYDASMARLTEIFGIEPVRRAAGEKIAHEMKEKKNALVEPDESQWPQLLLQLKAMNIREEVIAQAKAEKTIAANREGQILFSKQPWGGVGAESDPRMVVVDPAFPEIPVMETGKDDLFLMMDYSFAVFDEGKVETIEKDCIICATPIDALAIKSHADHRNAHVVAIGQEPGESVNEAVKFFAEQSPGRLYFAESLLAHGKNLAEWLAEHFAGFIKKIALPDKCRSWIRVHTAAEPEASPGAVSPANATEKKDTPEGPTIE